ncbi:hypothetical protein JCM9279_003694 [Rhodotorula babjevae]
MSLRSARSLLSAAQHHAAPSTSRALSSSAPAAAKGVLSPLHKTAILRRERAAKGAGRSGQAGNEAKVLPLEEAAKLLQERSRKTPNAAYEINITTKPSGSVQLNALRGRVFLPHSCTSSTKRETLYVFAQGVAAQKARDQGADVVGGEELIEQLLNGSLAVPDKLITTSDMFALFQRNPQLARLLGPRGLMPSVKRGTVADDVEQAIKEARGGLDWKGDSKGVVRAAIGRLHFTPDNLADNVHTLLASVSDIALGGSGAVNGVPARVKRPAITRVLISSTQGPGIVLADL